MPKVRRRQSRGTYERKKNNSRNLIADALDDKVTSREPRTVDLSGVGNLRTGTDTIGQIAVVTDHGDGSHDPLLVLFIVP